MEKYYCYFDGAITINTGGDMGMGCYVSSADGEVIYEYSDMIRRGFNNSCNVAEYLAFEALLQWLIDNLNESAFITIYGDSQLVCMQMKGRWRIKEGMYTKHAHRCKKLLLTLIHKHTHQIQIEWIPREENSYADMLSRRSLSDLFI